VAIIEHPSAVDPQHPPGRWAALVGAVRDASRRRKLASLAIALALEALILLLLLTLGTQIAGVEDGEAVTTFEAIEFAGPSEPEPETSQAEDAAAAETPQETLPVTDQPVPQPQRPSPLALNPQPAPQPAPPASPQPQPSPSSQPQPPAPAKPKIGARINPGRTYGPADTGNPRSAGDSERVGTAPNGEPLYAARWYREPTDQELAGYLSTANGPGYALIACRTVDGYYVEDCQLLSEGPPGSMMGRAVLAAAWQFRVRPARIGGREQFGSWVRIRIDYTVRQRPR
jgi:protein TonB